MLNLIGNYSLVFALFTSLILIVFTYINFKSNKNLNFNIFGTVVLQFILICISFFVLVIAFIYSDFNNAAVYYNSHTSKPLFYKISGTWGNHEGSLLLWLLVLSLFTLIFLLKSKKLLNSFRVLTIFFSTNNYNWFSFFYSFHI